MKLRVEGISHDEVVQFRQGGPDANAQPALLRRAEGGANPCRHCLGLIAEGERKLILSYRPFPTLQPYAETGPIFLHADACERYVGDSLPDWFAHLDPAIVRGYGSDDWIRYETARIVRGPDLASACAEILVDPAVTYVHIRSRFNCFQCRVERA